MTINDELIDAAMLRVAETILRIAQGIKAGTIPDCGTVQTLTSLATSIVDATEGRHFTPGKNN